LLLFSENKKDIKNEPENVINQWSYRLACFILKCFSRQNNVNAKYAMDTQKNWPWQNSFFLRKVFLFLSFISKKFNETFWFGFCGLNGSFWKPNKIFNLCPKVESHLLDSLSDHLNQGRKSTIFKISCVWFFYSSFYFMNIIFY